jgi:broad specificity phosphatase PhoE
LEKLIIVRHGKTANNAAGLLQGQQDIPLSDVGIQQAESLAQTLATERIDLIISSPLARALTTAEIINHGRNIPVSIDPDLRERSFGQFQGQSIKTYQDALSASGMTRLEYQPPEGECITEVATRAARAYEAMRSLNPRTLLVSAHEGINKCLILMLLGQPLTEWLSIKQENCCINEFCFDAQQTVTGYTINRHDHLPVFDH